jgi:hypothetical protein
MAMYISSLIGICVVVGLVVHVVTSHVRDRRCFHRTAARDLWISSTTMLEIARQDANPVLAILHATASMVRADAVRRLVNADELVELCDADADVSSRIRLAEDIIHERSIELKTCRIPSRHAISLI